MNLNKTKTKSTLKNAREVLISNDITPRVLTSGETITFGGRYGVERAELLLHWLVHMAAGKPFLGMTPPRPLKVFYMQAESDKTNLEKVMKSMQFDPELMALSKPNLSVSAGIDSIGKLSKEILCAFCGGKVDVIVLDGESKIFAGDLGLVCLGDMNNFARDKLDVLREAVNPDCGIILVQYVRLKADEANPGYEIMEVMYRSVCDVYLGRNGDHPTRRVLNFTHIGKTGKCQVIDKIDGNWFEVKSVALRCQKKARV